MFLNVILLISLVFVHFINAQANSCDILSRQYNLSKEASNYLEEALSYMEKGSINRQQIDWDLLRSEVYRTASNAVIPKDTYRAITEAVSLLQDHHSFFMTPDQLQFFETKNIDHSIDIIRSHSELINGKIGYIKIPSCNSLSDRAMKEYAEGIQQEISTLDSSMLNKWIIDLRGNSGGNMWPMVLGLRPLIQAEIFGFFSDGSGEFVPWHFDGAGVKCDTLEICSLNKPSYLLKQLPVQIAILIDHKTASSGEATILAFLGGNNCKTFGEKTGGYTSANEAIRLRDGAAIFLSTTYSADRLGRIYIDGIAPDKLTESGECTLNEAIKWLE